MDLETAAKLKQMSSTERTHEYLKEAEAGLEHAHRYMNNAIKSMRQYADEFIAYNMDTDGPRNDDFVINSLFDAATGTLDAYMSAIKKMQTTTAAMRFIEPVERIFAYRKESK